MCTNIYKVFDLPKVVEHIMSAHSLLLQPPYVFNLEAQVMGKFSNNIYLITLPFHLTKSNRTISVFQPISSYARDRKVIAVLKNLLKL